jgi:Do/DeqQ family serine protease
MNQTKVLAAFAGIALAAGLGGAAIYDALSSPVASSALWNESNGRLVADHPALISSTDFSAAAETAVHAVVHVKTSVEQGYTFNPFQDFFFGFGNTPQMQPRIVQGSGSGVIISPDGFIVTNNHVIDKAKEVKVSLNNNKEYVANVVGVDPTTDLAVLKIEAENLPTLAFANSDDLRLGEWVLAVGNPFNLNSTVTAGIISAKGRSINIIDNQSAIEAFIQTDAVVNPGNSGGALINTRGDLIGINTAISTRTGSYEGYSFAVPANIVRKVVDDLTKYGVVQRAYLGVNIADITPELAKELSIKESQGVYISDVTDGGAAAEAGIKKGDVLVQAGGKSVKKMSELLEVIGSRRPGDKLSVVVLRDGKEKVFNVTLRNRQGNTEVLKKDDVTTLTTLGATFEPLSPNDKARFGLRTGVKIVNPGDGKLAAAGVPAGFILVKLNNKLVSSAEEVAKILGELGPGDGVLIQGYRPNGRAEVFAFAL